MKTSELKQIIREEIDKVLKEAKHPIGSLGNDMSTTPNPNISQAEYEADVKLWSSKAMEFEKIKKNLETRLKRTKNASHKETLEGEIEYVQDQIDVFKGMVYDLRRIIKNIK